MTLPGVLTPRTRMWPMADIAILFKGYPETFLECRAYGHDWPTGRKRHKRTRELFDAGASVHGVPYLQLTLKCGSCGTERYDRYIKRNGVWVWPDDPAVLGARYGYADGFLLAADAIEGGGPSRVEVREYLVNKEAGTIAA